MFKTILNPDLYHGKHKKTNFFEGWYFKIADKSGKNVLALIPGISKAKDPIHHHSFIQILDGMDKTYNYVKGSESDFHYSEDAFDIDVFGNKFSENSIDIDIARKEKSVKGKLEFKNIKKWPDTLLNPGSMGYYNYLKFMECYSQVTVMDGDITGSLVVDEKQIDFDEGKIYIEKNWGKEFPRSWIWVQSNSFEDKSVAFTCSIGRVPLGPISFSGFLVGIYVKNDFYEFTTINRAKVQIKRNDEDVELVFSRKNYRLSVKTKSKKEDFLLCKGPREGKMVPLVNEALTGDVALELVDTASNKIIYKGTGKATGIEYGGELMF